MNAHVRGQSRFLCLLLLLSASACDRALAEAVAPRALTAETPAMHGDEDGSEDPRDEPTLPKIICCNCNARSCTQPDAPDPS